MDAIIFVFSLENESSFQQIYTFYTKMGHFRNLAEIPIILVGTQGKYYDCVTSLMQIKGTGNKKGQLYY